MRKHAPNVIAMAMAAMCVVHCLVELEGAKLQTFTAEYASFKDREKYYQVLEVIGGAAISNGGLQLTPDSASADFMIGMRSGRILLKQRFKMWEHRNSATALASFNTSFLFNIYRADDGGLSLSQGLAFVIAPDLHIPADSIGPFLGLTSSSTDGRESNKLVAVELDSFKDDTGFLNDPDDNHVGIDVNSVRSIKTQSLTPLNINLTSDSNDVRFYNVWVDYDGLNTLIHVYIAQQTDPNGATPPKPHSPILSAPLNLRDHLNQYSHIGFSSSTSYGNVLNAVVRWNLTVHHFSDPQIKIKLKPLVLVLVLILLLLLLVGAAGIGYWFHKHKTASSRHNLMLALKRLPGMPREFKFRDLRKATNNFNDKNKLGQGGFGVVYRGVLPKEKVEIAVKWFSRENIKGQLDFVAELTVINRLRHKHLVKCH